MGLKTDSIDDYSNVVIWQKNYCTHTFGCLLPSDAAFKHLWLWEEWKETFFLRLGTQVACKPTEQNRVVCSRPKNTKCHQNATTSTAQYSRLYTDKEFAHFLLVSSIVWYFRLGLFVKNIIVSSYTKANKEFLRSVFSRLFCLWSKWFCRIIFANRRSNWP